MGIVPESFTEIGYPNAWHANKLVNASMDASSSIRRHHAFKPVSHTGLLGNVSFRI